MNLNDPFNRLSKKQQSEYIALRTSLKNASINSQSEVEALLKSIHQRTAMFGVVVVFLAALLIFFMPELKAILILFSVLALLWLLTTTLKSHGYIRRYIREEYPDKN